MEAGIRWVVLLLALLVNILAAEFTSHFDWRLDSADLFSPSILGASLSPHGYFTCCVTHGRQTSEMVTQAPKNTNAEAAKSS